MTPRGIHMIVLQASHIEKQFDGIQVLNDASLIVQTRDRVALIGPNGAGKSTLLRIIIGELEKDSGDVSLGKGVTIGYISQFVQADKSTTVYQYVKDVFASIYELEAKLRTLEKQMARPEVYEDISRFTAISNEYAALQHQFEEQGGYAVEARIRRVLDGLGFDKSLQQLPVDLLSGGQKTRLSLARLLAWQPGLLVLDEPTNYLDTETLTWLEGYLQGYEGALLVVSHDRYFLDQIATEIVELDEGKTTLYHGNYSDYIEEKANRMEAAQKEYEAQQKEIAKVEDFISRNIVRASTTKRAQSRRKMLAKMNLLERPSGTGPELGLRFNSARPSGKDVLLLENVTIGYGSNEHDSHGNDSNGRDSKAMVISKHIDLRIERGQRIAIVGPNGTGKTTLLKTIIGDLPPLAGHIHWGQHVQIGYYDQEQETLSHNKTVLDQVWDEHRDFDNTTIRTALARFLFRGEDLQKPVSALSGGERSRLNLCRLMLENSNTLLLDEPTNHLDLMSKEVLEDALSDYNGTLIFISHDRYFIDAIATHVAVLSDSGIKIFIGNYSDYREKQANEDKWAEEENGATETSIEPGTSTGSEKEGRIRVRSSDIRKAKERVAQIEARSESNAARQTEIAIELNEAALSQNVDKTKALQIELELLLKEEESLLDEWSNAASYLEELEKLNQ